MHVYVATTQQCLLRNGPHGPPSLIPAVVKGDGKLATPHWESGEPLLGWADCPAKAGPHCSPATPELAGPGPSPPRSSATTGSGGMLAGRALGRFFGGGAATGSGSTGTSTMSSSDGGEGRRGGGALGGVTGAMLPLERLQVRQAQRCLPKGVLVLLHRPFDLLQAVGSNLIQDVLGHVVPAGENSASTQHLENLMLLADAQDVAGGAVVQGHLSPGLAALGRVLPIAKSQHVSIGPFSNSRHCGRHSPPSVGCHGRSLGTNEGHERVLDRLLDLRSCIRLPMLIQPKRPKPVAAAVLALATRAATVRVPRQARGLEKPAKACQSSGLGFGATVEESIQDQNAEASASLGQPCG